MKFATSHFYHLLASALFLLLPQLSRANDSNFGAGIVLGDPSALTIKYWQTSDVAIDAGLAFHLQDYILLYSDYLVHFPNAFSGGLRSQIRLIPYIGVGALAVFTTANRYDEDRYYGRRSGSFGVGLRIPFGIEWLITKIPLGAFIEIVPGLSVLPRTGGFFQYGIGVRFYF